MKRVTVYYKTTGDTLTSSTVEADEIVYLKDLVIVQKTTEINGKIETKTVGYWKADIVMYAYVTVNKDTPKENNDAAKEKQQ